MISKESQLNEAHKSEIDTRVLARQLAYEVPKESKDCWFDDSQFSWHRD